MNLPPENAISIDMYAAGLIIGLIYGRRHICHLPGEAKSRIPGNIISNKMSFQAILDSSYSNRVDVINLVKALTHVDPILRPTAEVAMKHPAFDSAVAKCDRTYRVNAFLQSVAKGKAESMITQWAEIV
jgi:hypothetical protein